VMAGRRPGHPSRMDARNKSGYDEFPASASSTLDQSSTPAVSSAARTLGGDIGNSVSRRPIAWAIAFAIAAIGGQLLSSPTPLAPYGWAGLGTSTSTASIIGTSEATGTR